MPVDGAGGFAADASSVESGRCRSRRGETVAIEGGAESQ